MTEPGQELELLYKALSTPMGLEVEVSDFKLAQARLYQARRESNDPDLNDLSVRRPPDGRDGVLWIVKQKIEQNEPTGRTDETSPRSDL